MVALIFPGQGSQFVGMGKDLADAFPVARNIFQEADDVLGVKLSEIMWQGPEEELTRTHNAQPAILTHSIAVHRLLAEHLPEIRCAAGHSLGEFSAYVAAGAMSFADAVRTVRRRGELMLRAGQERTGTMAAILGMEDADLERVCMEASAQGGEVVPANYNAPGQLVISGDVPSVQNAMALAKQAGAKKAVLLNVSGAFHSPLMQAAEAGLHVQLDTVELKRPMFPVVSNVTAQPVTDVVDARRLLIQQLTSPVRWTACVRTMIAEGATELLELGPGNVLSGLMKRIDKSVKARAVGTADEVNAWPS
ncbi:MAG TPA: ACP S-malonyltransferase [Longimicrobiales bacterium]